MTTPKDPRDAQVAQPVRWLTFSDHDPDFLNLTYVYPVLSRRMQGISIGSRKYGHCFDAHFLGGFHYSNGNFPAVSY